ncbi:MAG: galactokinase [Alphaproteobacteria bacterium]
MTNNSAPAEAFGGLNLIGDYTEVAEGFVLSAKVPLQMSVSVELTDSGELVGATSIMPSKKTRGLNTDKDGSWTDYIIGCVREIEKLDHKISGLNVAVQSDVPMGIGLGSSSALTVATLKALRASLNLGMSDMDIVRLSQKVETEFMQRESGLIEPLTASMQAQEDALFFDARTLETKTVSLMDTHSIAVINTGEKSQAMTHEIEGRIEAFSRAAEAFGIDALRDADMGMVLQLEGLDGDRARHVVRENELVLDATQALEDGDVEFFGELLTESHFSKSKDLKVSTPKIDHMVQVLNDNGALGCKLAGRGFGGCILALVENGLETKMLAGAKAVDEKASLITCL